MDLEQQDSGISIRSIFVTIGSVLGLVLVGFGLWALGGAIYFAWRLFRDPDGITYFATYFVETTKINTYLPGDGAGLAHYVSWVAVILLLLVLGKLGAWAVDAGARLLRTPKGR